jgi:hypothetical protein
MGFNVLSPFACLAMSLSLAMLPLGVSYRDEPDSDDTMLLYVFVVLLVFHFYSMHGQLSRPEYDPLMKIIDDVGLWIASNLGHE